MRCATCHVDVAWNCRRAAHQPARESGDIAADTAASITAARGVVSALAVVIIASACVSSVGGARCGVTAERPTSESRRVIRVRCNEARRCIVIAASR